MVNDGKIKEVTKDMEENKVKLASISVKELYGCYNYFVNFNQDITFIYGLNGCGKTTILNITEAIITGQLFKLFNYQFENIELQYVNSSNIKDFRSIVIYYEKQQLQVKFNDENYSLDLIASEDNIRSMKTVSDIFSVYFQRYEFLLKIRDTFNYVYLPLNRSNVSIHEMEDAYIYPRFHNRLSIDDIFAGIDNRDGAMIKIESLIYQRYSKASAAINNINDAFRNSMLKPQIELSNTNNFVHFLNEFRNNDISSLKRTKNVYIEILKEFKLINDKEEDNYNEFFETFINEFTEYNNSEELTIEFVFKLQEIARIQKTIDIAEKMEKRKAEIIKPMETFLSIMNSFIDSSDDEKELCISSDGQIYFKTKYSKKRIGIQHLSSGEKQLITFFANLIFNVRDESSGIFVVDEPELSLHLSWQKIFIDKVLEVNKNIQLIFATHAPEIIGNRRNKMYKLEKQYKGGSVK